jgi:hypothetical protein
VRDTVAEKVYRDYLHETNEEIERKRGVWRGLIRDGQDVDHNEARIAGLNRVVHERQRRKERREDLAEWTEWGKLFTTWGKLVGAFGSGVVATFVWKFVAQMWGR